MRLSASRLSRQRRFSPEPVPEPVPDLAVITVVEIAAGALSGLGSIGR